MNQENPKNSIDAIQTLRETEQSSLLISAKDHKVEGEDFEVAKEVLSKFLDIIEEIKRNERDKRKIIRAVAEAFYDLSKNLSKIKI